MASRIALLRQSDTSDATANSFDVNGFASRDCLGQHLCFLPDSTAPELSKILDKIKQ